MAKQKVNSVHCLALHPKKKKRGVGPVSLNGLQGKEFGLSTKSN